MSESAQKVGAEQDSTTADLPPPPERIVEALLFACGEPLDSAKGAEIIRGLSAEQFRDIIDKLNRDYKRQGRPYLIQAKEGGWVMALRNRYRTAYQRLFGSPREAHLSQSAVDVLALVAYRQPVSRHEIDSIRGADSAAVLRQLLRRNLIAVARRTESTDNDVTYGTTKRFLDFFGLTSLEDLPHTQDLQRI